MMSAWHSAGLLLLAMAMPVAAGQAPPPDAATDPEPLKLRTDRQEYCTELAQVVRQTELRQPGPHPDIDVLVHDGVALCSAGNVRVGVFRLRTALVRLGGG